MNRSGAGAKRIADVAWAPWVPLAQQDPPRVGKGCFETRSQGITPQHEEDCGDGIKTGPYPEEAARTAVLSLSKHEGPVSSFREKRPTPGSWPRAAAFGLAIIALATE